jgi:hypothetical protein
MCPCHCANSTNTNDTQPAMLATQSSQAADGRQRCNHLMCRYKHSGTHKRRATQRHMLAQHTEAEPVRPFPQIISGACLRTPAAKWKASVWSATTLTTSKCSAFSCNRHARQCLSCRHEHAMQLSLHAPFISSLHPSTPFASCQTRTTPLVAACKLPCPVPPLKSPTLNNLPAPEVTTQTRSQGSHLWSPTCLPAARWCITSS